MAIKTARIKKEEKVVITISSKSKEKNKKNVIITLNDKSKRKEKGYLRLLIML